MVQRESHLRDHSRNFLRRAFYTKMHIFCMDRENGFFLFYFDVLQVLFAPAPPLRFFFNTLYMNRGTVPLRN